MAKRAHRKSLVQSGRGGTQEKVKAYSEGRVVGRHIEINQKKKMGKCNLVKVRELKKAIPFTIT